MLKTSKERNLLITYCDRCSSKHGYPISAVKVKAKCNLCGFTGMVTITRNSKIVSYEEFNEEKWNGGGFEVIQLDPFPLGQLREMIHPTLPNKLLTEKCSIFFDKNAIIIANQQTGQQIQITF